MTMFAGISIDYRRFYSDSMLNCYKMERDAIKEICPDAFITTNLMGTFKGLDYFKWAKGNGYRFMGQLSCIRYTVEHGCHDTRSDARLKG